MPKSILINNTGRAIGKLVFSLSSLLIFFGVLELCLRLAGFGNTREENPGIKRPLFQMGGPLRPVDPPSFGSYYRDNVLFWRLKPNEDEDVNIRGYRGTLCDYQKPQGVYRIILLGDSCVYGMNFRHKDTYAYLLEEKLNALYGGRVEIINAGVPGYSSLQGLRYLKKELIRYKPDMLLVGFGFNDLCEALGSPDKDIRFLPEFLVGLDNSLSRLRLYVFLKQIIFNLKSAVIPKYRFSAAGGRPRTFVRTCQESRELEQLIQEYTLAFDAPARRVSPRDFVSNIREIIKFGAKNHIRVVLLAQPSVESSFVYEPVLSILAKEYNIGLVDLVEEFKKRKANRQEYFLDNNHYNEKGHRLIADILYDRLHALVFAD